MNENLKQLLDKFAKYFPDLDFSNVASGYNEVEEILKPHVQSFSREQWQVILNGEYNNLFQTGVPHISWNTDRANLLRAVIGDTKPVDRWDSSWYDFLEYSIRTDAGVCLRIVMEIPKVCSGGQTSWLATVVDKVKKTPTHIAVVIAVMDTFEATVVSQFQGSKEECEKWLKENAPKKASSMIIEL